MSNTDRTHDLVLWGATGVAGRLVAEHLTEQYTPDDLSVALGGRDETRLRELEATLVDQRADWTEIPIVVGDATDRESLDAIAEATRVVCTTVGPYTKYGTPLVEACIAAGTDYCDLTGEINWVREMIDRYHEDAVDAGARIVHSCGFDSIPADLGTKLVQSYAIDEFGSPCDLVRIYLEDGRGGVSGGTASSALEMFRAAATDPVARKTLRNPYSLAPPGERDGVDPGAQSFPRNDPLRGEWTAPSPMAAVNERVIRRSNALLGYPWGREFECTEVVPVGSGPVGMAGASAVTAGLGVATAALTFGPTREALRRVAFPDPGEGPTREEIENGYFTIRVLGRGTAPDGPFVVESRISADRDPGYGATAKMLGEAAMCLVREEIDSPLEGGVLTPASAIGDPLADRLRQAGLVVDVGEWDGAA
ncbi:saccharopine dehydrogenase family protein [Halobiforma nitratireducens]|uniref:Saccharopine dehydrogenase n=1 Tax=Halobiforma nitratireducens JCM 10879 TaxID=1227454 RepID=M0LXG0_9EURY|nr:saccharopine dehydrogenase NADP-binding domain-containing protein [Halobiforma nitratireducens]EMA37863.1 saccharopine dehydrogenase [Halobiforma nitratireducens JCM 10879]